MKPLNTKNKERLVLQVWDAKSPLSPLAFLSMERALLYALKYQADYHLITDNETGIRPNFLILEAYKFDYEKIFYLDSDAVIMKECPNIFEFNKFSAVPDADLRFTDPKTYNNQIKERFAIPLDHIYFNSGVLLFTKEFLAKTKEWIAPYLPKHIDQKSQWDQSLLNEIVGKHYGLYHTLSSDWNAWYKPASAKYIEHYAAYQRGAFDMAALRRRLV